MRIIKTYANGRFYDTLNKRYMGKEQLASLLEKKEAIKIIMHKTDSDVTQSVAKQLAPLMRTESGARFNIDNLRQWVSDQVDRRIEKAVALVNLPTRDQIRRLTIDIETLTKQVDGLQDRLVKVKTPVETPPADAAMAVGPQT
ncbi:MAG: polyhydroxyalkanoate synthesis regulator DNA-binding domain-containing protein [Desulfosarcina sp.]|jgi:hypothetical protein